MVVDLQVGLARWPAVRPATAPQDEGIARLGWREALLAARRQQERAAWPARRPAARAALDSAGERPAPPAAAAPEPTAPTETPASAAAAAPARRRRPGPPEDVPAYEARRERELAAPMAAMSAFCRRAGHRALLRDAVWALLRAHRRRVRADERAPLHRAGGAASTRAARGAAAEVELITRAVRRVAGRGSARPSTCSRPRGAASLRAPPHFTEDGVHLSAAGNAALGRLIACASCATAPAGRGERTDRCCFTPPISRPSSAWSCCLRHARRPGLAAALMAASYFFYGYIQPYYVVLLFR